MCVSESCQGCQVQIYISEFIGDNLHTPKILFSIIDSVLSPSVNIFLILPYYCVNNSVHFSMR